MKQIVDRIVGVGGIAMFGELTMREMYEAFELIVLHSICMRYQRRQFLAALARKYARVFRFAGVLRNISEVSELVGDHYAVDCFRGIGGEPADDIDAVIVITEHVPERVDLAVV